MKFRRKARKCAEAAQAKDKPAFSLTIADFPSTSSGRVLSDLADHLHEFVIDGWPQSMPNIVREWFHMAFETPYDRY